MSPKRRELTEEDDGSEEDYKRERQENMADVLRNADRDPRIEDDDY